LVKVPVLSTINLPFMVKLPPPPPPTVNEFFILVEPVTLKVLALFTLRVDAAPGFKIKAAQVGLEFTVQVEPRYSYSIGSAGTWYSS
jgi:hypothetical protein